MSNKKQKIKLDKSTIIILVVLGVVVLTFIGIKIFQSIDFSRDNSDNIKIESTSNNEFESDITEQPQSQITEPSSQPKPSVSKSMPEELINTGWFYIDDNREYAYRFYILSDTTIEWQKVMAETNDFVSSKTYSYTLQNDTITLFDNGKESTYQIIFDIKDMNSLWYNEDHIIIKGDGDMSNVWGFYEKVFE